MTSEVCMINTRGFLFVHCMTVCLTSLTAPLFSADYEWSREEQGHRLQTAPPCHLRVPADSP